MEWGRSAYPRGNFARVLAGPAPETAGRGPGVRIRGGPGEALNTASSGSYGRQPRPRPRVAGPGVGGGRPRCVFSGFAPRPTPTPRTAATPRRAIRVRITEAVNPKSLPGPSSGTPGGRGSGGVGGKVATGQQPPGGGGGRRRERVRRPFRWGKGSRCGVESPAESRRVAQSRLESRRVTESRAESRRGADVQVCSSGAALEGSWALGTGKRAETGRDRQKLAETGRNWQRGRLRGGSCTGGSRALHM